MDKNTISSLSQKEAEIVARMSYEQKDIVTAKELDTYLPAGFRYRRKLVYGLKKKKILISIKNGFYIFVPLDAVPTGRRISELLIPAVFFPQNDYYIGYSTMFNYYNFTDQQFQTVYVLNPRISRERTIAGISFKFIKIPAQRIYGLEKINIKGKIAIVSSKERTLVDLIYYNKPVGGINAAADIMTRFVKEKKCDTKKLVEYAVKFPIIKTRKLIGLILENTGVSDSLLKPLERSVKKTSLISFTNNRRGSINEKWRAIVSAS
ncbi:MAG: type IV toxin-antitoxin system AbiEi family antitoxin [Smithellaceae bacterium]|jgi:predicted transcriptional regulator of viral defense system